jgi:hypothetical protein
MEGERGGRDERLTKGSSIPTQETRHKKRIIGGRKKAAAFFYYFSPSKDIGIAMQSQKETKN